MIKFIIPAMIDPESLGGDIDDAKRFGELRAEIAEGGRLSFSLGTESRPLTAKEAKALARYLNSWAGLVETGNSFEGIEHTFKDSR